MKKTKELNPLILLKSLWAHIHSNKKIKLYFLLVLMIVSSFADVVSIGAVVPFLGALATPEKLFQFEIVKNYGQLFGIVSSSDLLLPLTIIFIMAAILAALIRLILIKVSTKISFAIGSDLSLQIYRNILSQPYAFHISRNSSDFIDAVTIKSNEVIYSALMPALIFVSSCFTLFAILGALLFINPIVSVIAIGIFSCLYGVIIFTAKTRIRSNSETIAKESSHLIKSLQEGFGGIRDILIDGTQEAYCSYYDGANQKYKNAQCSNQFISLSPRHVIEGIGIILVAIFSYYLASQSQGFLNAIPLLGVLALAAQRLLPILQQIYGAWSNINGSQATLRQVIIFLNLEHYQQISSDTSPLSFKKEIALQNLSFSYDGQRLVLDNINLKLFKGERVGIIGETGSGKSTLIDILMGLIEPTDGAILIDGSRITRKNSQSWRKNIAHVPQSIYIADGAIEENIAFGVVGEKINDDRVYQAAKNAQILDTIHQQPNQFKERLGERGVRLSGGQRQRIGIARALYKNAQIIFLDEATSALDSKTESDVMESINALNKAITMIIVAHRISTLKHCTKIIELKNGKINRVGNYSELFGNVNH